MNTNFTIKNFRLFDENGVDIDLTPITILTGTNSAGKSSIVKAVALLYSFLDQIKNDKKDGKNIDLSRYKLEFNKIIAGTLGNFEDTLHKGSSDHSITFEYTMHSCMLFEDVKISFTFEDADEGKNNTYMHNGELVKFSVKSMDDVVIYSTSKSEIYYNFNLIKKQFPVFAIGEMVVYGHEGRFTIDGENREDRKKIQENAKEFLNEIEKEKRIDIYNYMRNSLSYDEPIITIGSYSEKIVDVNNGKQIFQIPLLDECLSGLTISEQQETIEAILNGDEELDDAEKYIIRRLVSNILSKEMSIPDFWKNQEIVFLQNVGKREDSPENSFFRFKNGKVIMPVVNMLSVEQNLWKNYPGLYSMKNEDENKKAQDICNWKNQPLDSFSSIYEILMHLNSAYFRWKKISEPESLYSFREWLYDGPDMAYKHHVYELLCKYASRVIEEVLYPDWSENFYYVSSTRALPKRIYTRTEGEEFYRTLNEYLNAKTEYETYQKHIGGLTDKNSYVPDSFLNRWIGSAGFGIGQSISVESIYGAALVVHLINNDGSRTLLANEGFGLTQLISILLNIETVILKARGMKYRHYSQLSKLDGLNPSIFHYEKQTIAIEEPEIHLHPAFQSMLADMFASASEYNIHFIVETHSEYLVRRAQRLVAEGMYQNEEQLKSINPFKVIYCPQNGKPYDMGMNINGRFTNFFDVGFFDVASKEAIALSKIERSRV